MSEPERREQYEYTIIPLAFDDAMGMQKILDYKGEQGWELVSVVKADAPAWKVMAFFKRRKS